MLHCSQKAIVLKPGTRISLCHQYPEHRFLLASSRGYPEPCPASKGIRIDSTGQGTFSLHLGDLPLTWSRAGLWHLPRNAWRPGQKWTPPTVDTHNSPHGFLTGDRARLHAWSCSRPATLRPPQGHKHCFGLHFKVFRETCIFHQLRKGWRFHWAAGKDFCRSSISMDSGHPSVFSFPFTQVSGFFIDQLKYTF